MYRDRYRCVKCGRRRKLEVDHVVGIAQGGEPFEPTNLQTLCRTCNMAKMIHDREDGRRGYSLDTDAAGRFVDARHPSNATSPLDNVVLL